MRELSLFSGAGGGLLGSKLLGWTTVGYVEYEEYCQKVLRQRIADGILDAAPIFGDIRKFISEGYADAYQGMVDVVTGGFPCQDISSAGNGRGLEGERSGLWREMSEIIGIVRPKFVLVENSPMLTIRGGVRVVGDLTQLGYSCRWGVIGASAIGACHHRERIWILAYSNGHGLEGNRKIGNSQKTIQGNSGAESAAVRIRKTFQPQNANYGIGENDVVAHWVDRIKAIGNGQVPLCMAYAFSKLSSGVIE